MRVTFRPKSTIIILLIFNLLIISAVVYLLLEINKTKVLNLEMVTTPIALPLLKEDIEKIGISSRAYIIYDQESRTVFWGKNEKLRFSPASSTKIMTAIIALEEYNLDREFTAIGLDNVEGSTMKLHEGETITVENLLYGLMLPSGNDAAYVLANSYPGGEAGFVARMNGKAKELNLINTKFIDSAGYSDDNYTTAYDLARLASYALRNPRFAAIVSTKNRTVTDITGTITHELSNLNELLGIKGVSGVKTGFTEEALGVLVSSVEHDGRTYIIVVLGSHDRFLDTKNIIDRAVEKITLIFY